jgi:Leucine-rich repeat (LRR) protein
MEIKKLPENMSQMISLTSLTVASNKKLTEIPESIFGVKNLEVLNLSDNNLKIIPEGINNLENLKYLYLTSNSLKSLPDLSNLIKLEYLELDNNKLNSLPESIIGMENLESMSVYGNPLKAISKPVLSFLKNLDVYVDGVDGVDEVDEVDESDYSTSNISNENDTSRFLQVNGYGVETFAGTVEAATYQYFEDNDIDLEDYSNDVQWGDDDCQVPEEHNFGGYGLYEVDNLWHVNGAYLTEDTQIELVNSSEDTLWSSNCDTESLESQGIKLICVSSQEDIFDSLDLKTVVMIGRIFQQGCTFENQLKDIENFDPNNLTIYYHEDESGSIIKKIEYNDTELENGNSSTSGSGSEYSWEVIG